MALPKKFLKYKDAIKVMRDIGMSDIEIEEKLGETEFFKDLIPITFQELKDMSDDERSKLISYCWHEGRYRCDTVGIHNVKFTDYENYSLLTFSDNDGDPSIEFRYYNEEIDNVGDGEWNYGLYKRKDE